VAEEKGKSESEIMTEFSNSVTTIRICFVFGHPGSEF
jgi:hypothetical protein